MNLVIEIKEDRDLRIYADADVELTVVDWAAIKEDANTLFSWETRSPIADAARELLHKTTGLKQVYP